MKLSFDKLVFCLKNTKVVFIITIIMTLLVLTNSVFAGTPPNADVEPNVNNEASPTKSDVIYQTSQAPIYTAGKTYPGGTPMEPATYVGDTAPLIRYYDEQIKIYGYMNSVHEENYAYSNGSKEYNIYNGVLSHIIGDFDKDGSSEMFLYRIRTTGMGELATKEIILEVVKTFNGQAVLSETQVLCTDIFDGESIDVSAGYKLVNDVWKFYFNYFENKILQKEYINKFIAIEYPGSVVMTHELNYSGYEDEVNDDQYDFLNQVLDSGIILKDDADIMKRSFINDDVNLTPIFTIKRTNESMREGFMEEYTESHYEEMEKNGYVKAKYGYTTFIDRTTTAEFKETTTPIVY